MRLFFWKQETPKNTDGVTTPLLAKSSEPSTPDGSNSAEESIFDAFLLGGANHSREPAEAPSAQPAPPSMLSRWFSSDKREAPNTSPQLPVSRTNTDLEAPRAQTVLSSATSETLRYQVGHSSVWLGIPVGGTLGAVLGLQYANSPADNWPFMIYPPFFAVTTAMSMVALFQLAQNELFDPERTLFAFTNRHIDSLRLHSPGLMAQLLVRQSAATLGGLFVGAWLGLEYGTSHGGGWHFVYAAIIAGDMVIPSRMLARWFIMPVVNAALDAAARCDATYLSRGAHCRCASAASPRAYLPEPAGIYTGRAVSLTAL